MSKGYPAGDKLVRKIVTDVMTEHSIHIVKKINTQAIELLNQVHDEKNQERMRLASELAPYIWSQYLTIEKCAVIAGLPLDEFTAILKHHQPKRPGDST